MPAAFIHDDFLLQTSAARDLYHGYAAGEPILDFHNHLPPNEIATNRRFETLYDVWLAGDHYKWRAMRANGIAERFCTGDASPREKFDAWAATVPHTLRNPLYHWTHLELARYFETFDLFGPDTADALWDKANELLALPAYTTRGLLECSHVRALCTTDDPTDSLEHHQAIAADPASLVRVYPTFRPDAALRLETPADWNAWVDKLSAVSGLDCGSLAGLLDALRARHDFFHALGGRLSDHGLHHIFDLPCSREEAAHIFDKARRGGTPTEGEVEQFGNFLMLFFGELDASRGWTKQLHIGAERNNSTERFQSLGRDIGCDSMADVNHAGPLRRYLDTLEQRGHLPQVMLYNLNPRDNYAMATMLGNFQGGGQGGRPSRLQLGTAWWFMDTREGMEWQINAFSNTGLLSRFVGMLTDSRSFLSFARHEYFRRILCDLLGGEMERGELPRDLDLVGGLVKRVCFRNAAEFFGLDLG